ncbi:MAG: hypothetical protein DMD54_04830 [Gemmatimonadetes bacterium]|nr:MAG: hypothetical protein DMD54_04830 [Gemmatimonadota bacterium]
MTTTVTDTPRDELSTKPSVRGIAHATVILLALAAIRIDALWMWLANRRNWASWGFGPGMPAAWDDAFYYLRSHLAWVAFTGGLASVLFAGSLFRVERGRMRWFTLFFALAIFVFIMVSRLRSYP